MAQQLHGNTQPAPHARPLRTAPKRHETTLLLYVIDYCEKRKYTEAAASLRRDSGLPPASKPPMDSKEGLLYEWWICFWEIYTARLHPDKSSDPVAKIYSDSLQQNRLGQPRDGGGQQPSNGGRPAPGTASSQTPPGVNGQGPSPSYTANPSNNVNGVQPPSGGGAIPGMPAAAANPLHNPNLQHLQQRIPGYPPPGPGMPMYTQQRPLGAPMGPGGPMPMGPMGTPMQPGRMPNGVVYAQNPNYRPQGVQQSPQQMQDMQTAGASGSPKLAANQDSSPQIQEASRNGGSFEDGHQQGTPRMQNNRPQKRPSPAEDDQYPKDDSSPSNKRLKRSPQENGPTLPNTPSLAAAQPPGPGRPSGMAPGANGMPLNKPGPGGQFPPGGPNLSTPLPSNLTNQLQQLNNAHAQRSQGALPQADQQYFAQLQQTAHATYNIKSASYPPANPLPQGPPSEPPIRGATSAPKGSMLPPPPPGPTGGQPTTQPSNGTPGKNTPGPSGLVPRPGGNKDGSSPGGAEGISPEAVRPGSRPTLGSTPQMTPSAIPGTTSTPGGPSAISAPSPSQMTTPQQISRPQTQSPSSAALGRPPSAPTNGLGGGGGATPGPAGGAPAPVPNPSALLARGFPTPGGSGGGGGGMQGGGPGSQSTPAHSASGMGGSGSMLGGTEPLTNDLFMGLGSNPLTAPFDFQMMGYHEGEGGFPSDMNFDLGAGFSMDNSYDMSMYLDDNTLDSVNGP